MWMHIQSTGVQQLTEVIIDIYCNSHVLIVDLEVLVTVKTEKSLQFLTCTCMC